MKNHYSNGKLLLTGEYVVLDGAKGLALPTKYGQRLEVSTVNQAIIDWRSYDYLGKIWIQATFPISDFYNSEKRRNSETLENRLFQIIYEAHQLNPEILEKSGYFVRSVLDFPSDWGLGTSSTLINNISQWFKIDPFILLQKTFGGSGYDIASAQIGQPIIYQLPKNIHPIIYSPSFKENLFFVHLNKKQNSREAINNYRNTASQIKETTIQKISSITERIIDCNDLNSFQNIIIEHENLIADVLKIKTIKELFFSEYPHGIKSLGAWGGDFILAVGSKKDKNFFKERNYTTILDYSEMILQQ